MVRNTCLCAEGRQWRPIRGRGGWVVVRKGIIFHWKWNVELPFPLSPRLELQLQYHSEKCTLLHIVLPLNEKYSARLSVDGIVCLLSVLLHLIGLGSEGCVCTRLMTGAHCAKRINGPKSHQRRLWTVKPSMAGSGSCVLSPCHPLGGQQKDATWQQIDFDLFYLCSLHRSLCHLLLGFLPLGILFRVLVCMLDCVLWLPAVTGFHCVWQCCTYQPVQGLFCLGFKECGTMKSSSVVPCLHIFRPVGCL